MAHQVTKVNLTDRSKARLEAETVQQRATKPHDIRGAIPKADWTDPAKFPPYMFREYPKMPLLDNNRPIVIDESGGVLVFHDATDEEDFMSMNPDIVDEIERNTPARALSDAIAAKDTEIEDLRARLRAAGLAEGKPKSRNALEGAVRPSAPVAAEVTEDASPAQDDGLRGTLPKANPLKKKKH